jgi:hypothetical protein
VPEGGVKMVVKRRKMLVQIVGIPSRFHRDFVCIASLRGPSTTRTTGPNTRNSAVSRVREPALAGPPV